MAYATAALLPGGPCGRTGAAVTGLPVPVYWWETGDWRYLVKRTSIFNRQSPTFFGIASERHSVGAGVRGLSAHWPHLLFQRRAHLLLSEGDQLFGCENYYGGETAVCQYRFAFPLSSYLVARYD